MWPGMSAKAGAAASTAPPSPLLGMATEMVVVVVVVVGQAWGGNGLGDAMRGARAGKATSYGVSRSLDLKDEGLPKLDGCDTAPLASGEGDDPPPKFRVWGVLLRRVWWRGMCGVMTTGRGAGWGGVGGVGVATGAAVLGVDAAGVGGVAGSTDLLGRSGKASAVRSGTLFGGFQ